MILGYARVSTAEQAGDDRTSLETQENVIHGYAMSIGADKFKVQLYTDAGVSGATPLLMRPAGREMYDAAKPGDTIVASKLDRLFRSAADALSMLKKFEQRDIKLVLFDMSAQPIGETGVSKLIFSILSAVAEFDRERIAERITDGKIAKKAKGGHVGGPAPYGHRKIGSGRSAQLEVDPREQEIIAYVKRHRRDKCESFATIQRKMVMHGMLSRTGKPFERVQLRRMLAEKVMQ